MTGGAATELVHIYLQLYEYYFILLQVYTKEWWITSIKINKVSGFPDIVFIVYTLQVYSKHNNMLHIWWYGDLKNRALEFVN